jgi:2,4-dienoyl-CoA reductase-like NADH-dependent reductase (Old Yellow Enzyme family)
MIHTTCHIHLALQADQPVAIPASSPLVPGSGWTSTRSPTSLGRGSTGSSTAVSRSWRRLAIDDTVALCRKPAARGAIDLTDGSSGGISPDVRIPRHPVYQAPFADTVKHRAGIATGAVGLITEPTHAAEIVANERADLVFAARVLLAHPAWPLRAAKALGVKPELPPPFWRATLG